jgi:hydrogenase expression/formation protein HypC
LFYNQHGGTKVCLAIPAKVVAINGDMATAQMEGTSLEACITLLPDVKVGDYILIHAGYALQRLDEEEAKVTLDYLREMGGE